MIFATSSGVPSRCRGICATIFSVPGDRIAVSISPGAMALTRIPCAPKSYAISRVKAASAAIGLGRDGGIVDQRMQLTVLEPALDLGDGDRGAVRIRQIDLDVILGTGFPGAFLREWVARAGDDPPAGAGESLHRRVADAAARAGQQQGAAGCVRHAGLIWCRSIFRDRAMPCSTARPVRSGGIPGDREAGTAARTRTR